MYHTGATIETMFRPLIQILQSRGYYVHVFSYDSRSNDVSPLVEKLRDYIIEKTVGVCDVVACSLGAYVAVKYIERVSDHRIRSVVFFSPLVNGAEALRDQYALHLLNTQTTGILLYEACRHVLSPETVPTSIRLGIIAGTKRIEKKNLLVSLFDQILLRGKKNDGLITVEETRFDHYKRVLVPVDHFTGIADQRVIELVVRFLETGSF